MVAPHRFCQLTVPAIGRTTQSAIPFPYPGRVFVWRVWRVRVPSDIPCPACVPDLIISERMQERVLFYVVKISPLGNSSVEGGRTHILDTSFSSQVNI